MMPLVVRHLRHLIPDWQDAVIVSPDAGGAKRYVVTDRPPSPWGAAAGAQGGPIPCLRF